MTSIGTASGKSATRIMMLGSGELGKEVIIEAMRLGMRVIACDRYEGAPGMQVAHENHVFNMLDGARLREVVEMVKPDFIVPEIEAIATDTLVELEKEGYNVIPNARATKLTMNREGIRRFAAEELGLKTSEYLFAATKEEFLCAVDKLGTPCVVKPIMSSSGKGQSVLRSAADIDNAWDYSQKGSRSGAGRVIVEKFIKFDYEITLLTVRHRMGTMFVDPIGHLQIDGDYVESWQPQPMAPHVLEEAKRVAKTVTDGIGGYGIFGVELFIKGDEVYFSEVSPRPHDTGMVTMISQNMSEFELHVRAILGLPLTALRQYGPAASAAILVDGDTDEIIYENIDGALTDDYTAIRIFGKPEVRGHRRMGVGLALGSSIDEARIKARKVRDTVRFTLK